jgi:hypothetical protein
MQIHPNSPLAKSIDAVTLKQFRITADRDAPDDASVGLNGQRVVGKTPEQQPFTATVRAITRRDAWALFCDATQHRGSIHKASIEQLPA